MSINPPTDFTSKDIHSFNSLGVYGLSKEIVGQPHLRRMSTDQSNVTALLLGAGNSSRFGAANKLLSLWRGEALLSHVARAIDNSNVSKTVVVTGHQAALVSETVSSAIDSLKVEFVHNEIYNTGMASSLVKGVSALMESDAVVVCLGDMPRIDSSVIDALIAAFCQHPGKGLYFPTYLGQRGNPVLIARCLFDSILALKGDTGARVLAEQFADAVMEVKIDCDGILQDIDTREQLSALIKKQVDI